MTRTCAKPSHRMMSARWRAYCTWLDARRAIGHDRPKDRCRSPSSSQAMHLCRQRCGEQGIGYGLTRHCYQMPRPCERGANGSLRVIIILTGALVHHTSLELHADAPNEVEELHSVLLSLSSSAARRLSSQPTRERERRRPTLPTGWRSSDTLSRSDARSSAPETPAVRRDRRTTADRARGFAEPGGDENACVTKMC